MIRFWKRLPRGWKLGLDLLAVLLLLFISWLMLGTPFLSANAAFRRAMTDSNLPAGEPELLVELNYDGELDSYQRTLALRADDKNCYLAVLEHKVGWNSGEVWTVPAAEGVQYTYLGWEIFTCGSLQNFYKAYQTGATPHIPAFAVKAPGADASLTLKLGDYDYGFWQFTPGSFPLVLEKAENGWFIFCFDTAELLKHFHAERVENWADLMDQPPCELEEPYESLRQWMDFHDLWNGSVSDSASLELTTRDAQGKVLRQLSWPLPKGH